MIEAVKNAQWRDAINTVKRMETFNNTFLHGDLEENVHIRPPLAFKADGDNTHVVFLDVNLLTPTEEGLKLALAEHEEMKYASVYWTYSWVLHYLKSNPRQGILLPTDSDLRLFAYCKRSVMGYFVKFGQSPTSWKTKKHSTISCFSGEAGYRAMAAATIPISIPGDRLRRADEATLEEISYLLRIPQRKPYGTMEGNMAVDEKDSILASIPAELKEKGSLVHASLIEGKGGLQTLLQSIKEQDADKVSVSLASTLDTVAELELLQAPGLSFLLPEQYAQQYPRSVIPIESH
ncbi:Peptidyl-prolyl cis-trans isomerase CYP37, chloroplastic, partial [Mucuna pruriens]